MEFTPIIGQLLTKTDFILFFSLSLTPSLTLLPSFSLSYFLSLFPCSSTMSTSLSLPCTHPNDVSNLYSHFWDLLVLRKVPAEKDLARWRHIYYTYTTITDKHNELLRGFRFHSVRQLQRMQLSILFC